MLEVHPSGFYAWLKEPESSRQEKDERQSGLIKQYWIKSGGVYGYRKIYSDLRCSGELAGTNRVHRLMRLAVLKAHLGYKKPRHRGGSTCITTPNKVLKWILRLPVQIRPHWVSWIVRS